MCVWVGEEEVCRKEKDLLKNHSLEGKKTSSKKIITEKPTKSAKCYHFHLNLCFNQLSCASKRHCFVLEYLMKIETFPRREELTEL